MDVQVDVLPGSEGATDASRMSPHLFRSKTQAGHHLLVIDVHVLARGIQIDTALAVRDGETCLSPQRRLILHPNLVLTFDHDGPTPVLVPPPDAEPAKHLVTAVGLFGVGHSVESLVAHLDRGRRPPGSVRVLGGHNRHWLTPEPGFFAGQDRLVGMLQPEGAPPRYVVGGEAGVHAADGEGWCQVDRDDAGPGVRATDCGRPEHPLGAQVLGVVELASELGHTVGAQWGLAHPTFRDPDPRRRPGGHVSAPISTVSRARMMAPYPVHRQMFPARASLISVLLG